MFILILIMLVGGVVGRLFLQRLRLCLSRWIIVTVSILVGVLGYTVGADSQVAEALPRIGLLSLVLGVTGTLGAILGTYLLVKILRR